MALVTEESIMRTWFFCLLFVCAWPVFGYSQLVGIGVSNTIPRHPLPIPPVGNSIGGRSCYGPRPAVNYGVYGGYGYDPMFGFNYTGCYGYGGPGFGIGYSFPLYGPTYYSPAWGPYAGWNAPLTAAPVYLNPVPTLPTLPQWMIDEATVNPTLKSKPISQTHRSLVQPSTPEAQLRSVRMQAAGDRLFAKLDYSAAEKSYAKALQAAPDRPDSYVRLAIAKAARGDMRAAVAYLKQMADVDPTYPSRSDSLDTLFGHQHGLSKLQVKQRVADWTKQDIQDPDRIFLLASMLFFDGDDRFRTLLDTAVKLDGDLAHYRAFLDAAPAIDKTAIAPTPDEIDALSGVEKAPEPEPVAGPLPKPGLAPLKVPAKPAPPAPLLLPPSLPPVPMP